MALGTNPFVVGDDGTIICEFIGDMVAHAPVANVNLTNGGN